MKIIPELLHVSRNGLFIWPWSIITAKRTLELIRQYPENARLAHVWYDSYRFGCLVVSRRRKEKVSVRLVTDVQLDVEAIQDCLAGGGRLYVDDINEMAYLHTGKKVRYDVAKRYVQVADVRIDSQANSLNAYVWRGA